MQVGGSFGIEAKKMVGSKFCAILAVIYAHMYPTFRTLNQFKLKPTEHPESVKVAHIIQNFITTYFRDRNVYLSIFTDADTETTDADTEQLQNDLLINLAKSPSLNTSFSFLNISMSSRSQPLRYRFPIDLFLCSTDRLAHIR